ncbi:hypothetical protein ElyMa_003366200 [Elysia marginata]|uniref:Uncharacterized protein n=1 Tax=Elysia marginata TaxID=1093978 RepID=A0AAV4JJC4_9GAST|nr:hypothetical protein ElyMa_003366200 [Elysia marginata]
MSCFKCTGPWSGLDKTRPQQGTQVPLNLQATSGHLTLACEVRLQGTRQQQGVGGEENFGKKRRRAGGKSSPAQTGKYIRRPSEKNSLKTGKETTTPPKQCPNSPPLPQRCLL